MPVADDDYRKRLARRINSGGSLGPNIPPSMLPYQATATVPRWDKLSEDKMPQFMPGPVGAAGIGRVALTAAEEGAPIVARATVAALKSKPLQEALDLADEFGRGIVADEALGAGVLKYEDLPRYGMAAKGKLIDFLNEHLATGEMSVRDANRFVKAFPHYINGNNIELYDALVGGNSRGLIRMYDQGEAATQEIKDILSGIKRGERVYGPQELSQYMLGKLGQASSEISKIVDEWH
jgi:hypothetical protein